MAERFVPKILANYPKTLRTSAGDSYGPIYVFYDNSSNQQQWALNYIQYVQFFGHGINLLSQLAQDIGVYFINLGQQQYDHKDRVSIRQSLRYFHWAKTLFRRANEIGTAMISNKRERNVDKQIKMAEALLDQLSNNNNNNDDDDIDKRIICSQPTDDNDIEMHEMYQQSDIIGSSSLCETEMPDIKTNLSLSESTDSTDFISIGEKLLSQTKDFSDDQQSCSNIRIFLVQPLISTENFRSIHSKLSQLLGTYLITFREEDNYRKLMNKSDSQCIVLILSTNDNDNILLDKICSFYPSASIYLLQPETYTENKRQEVIMKYHQVHAMLSDAEELAIKITLDVALKCRIVGDRYARNNEKKCSTQMYDQCIQLLNQLNTLAQRNSNNHE